ncbi:MAG: hypothetical protein WCI02_02760 [Planctomycetota bacterium]
MDSFFSKVVARHTESASPVLQPRIPSRFEEPTSSVTNSWIEDASSTMDISRTNAVLPDSAQAREPRQIAALPHDFESSPRDVQFERGQDFDLDDRLRHAERLLRQLQSKDVHSTTSPLVHPSAPTVALPSLERVSDRTLRPTASEASSINRPSIPIPSNDAQPISSDRTSSRFADQSLEAPKAIAKPSRAEPPLLKPRAEVPPAPRTIPNHASASLHKAPVIATTNDASMPANNKTIHVSIGRIEIRSPKRTEESSKPQPSGPKPRIMTLTEYVQSRQQGRK